MSALITSRPGDVVKVDYGGMHPFERENLEIDPNGSRKLFTDGDYKPIRIFFDTSKMIQIVIEKLESSGTGDVETITVLNGFIDKIIPQAASLWSSAIRVIPVTGSLIIKKESESQQYSTCPIGDGHKHSEEGVENADLVIYVEPDSSYCDEGGAANRPFAYPCELDQHDRPIAGILNLCTAWVTKNRNGFNRDGAISDSQTKLAVNAVIHEIGHVLGMNEELFKFFRNPITGDPLTPRPFVSTQVKCLTGPERLMVKPSCNTIEERVSAGKRHFEIVTPTVQAVVRNQFDCQVLKGGILENQGGDKSCFGTNWDQRYFHEEAMSSVYQTTPLILSPITLALLEDSGWYRADYSVASTLPFGHGAGCDFVNERCIVDGGKVPSYSKGFFCNRQLKNTDLNTISSVYGCDAGHTHKAFCNLIDYNDPRFAKFSSPPPTEFQYFSNPSWGSYLTQTDFCPVALEKKSYLCSDNASAPLFRSKYEHYGDGSKCFNRYSNITMNSVCFSSRCIEEENVLEVYVGNETYICSSDSQLIKLPGEDFSFECPRMEIACPQFFCPGNCAGRGVCSSTSKQRQCDCFDPNDDTKGCTKTQIKESETCGDLNPSATSRWTIFSSSILCSGIIMAYLSA